ncbi:MAG: PQQ-binding-like beta-propeller repeat protein [Oscillospiraceae bacterium]|nr:PQQ-binding-like beta-propeller repeat protein [Oscillospiraceae bacterium]
MNNKNDIIKMRKRQKYVVTKKFFVLLGIVILMIAGVSTLVSALVSVGRENGVRKLQAAPMPEDAEQHLDEPEYVVLNANVESVPLAYYAPEAEYSLGQESEPETELAIEPEADLEPETDHGLGTVIDAELAQAPAPYELFEPHSLPETNPENFARFAFDNRIEGSLYPVHFGMPESYTSLGITTFRGNNFRNGGSWGTADIVEQRLAIRYQLTIGSTERRTVISCAEAGCTEEGCEQVHSTVRRWTGVGWSGQPAIVQWDFEIQQMMNLFPDKREKEGLIEVIYGTLDGNIYFFELKTGEPTRPPIHLGEPIKGGVTVDPRGYPLLYVGQGDQMRTNRFGYYFFSLIDGSELFFINGLDPFSRRGWGAFDGNPLIDSANDRMILAGENGVLYSIELNTDFDREVGTVSIDPVISRYRHTGSRRLGTENSPAAFSHYLFFADNSGIIQCLDLRTLEPVWVFDAGDDTDASIVLDWEEENQRLVLYTGTQVDLQGSGGRAFIRKLDASNGEVLWQHSYRCYYNPRVNGGVMATPIVGKHDLSDIVIFWVAMVAGRGGGGVLVAFDRQSGEIVWENTMPRFGWSSPVAVYTEDGRGFIIVGDSAGNLYLIRGTTGEVLYRISLGSNIEATPAVFGNFLVVGTRGQRIFGIEIM